MVRGCGVRLRGGQVVHGDLESDALGRFFLRNRADERRFSHWACANPAFAMCVIDWRLPMRMMRIMLAWSAASMLLAVVVGTSSARNLSVSETGGTLIFSPLTIEAAGRNFSCGLTMSGTISSRTFVKSASEPWFVNLTRGEASVCTGGSATVLTETLPWRFSYRSFSGTLPNITRIRGALIGLAISVRESGGTSCLGGTTSRNPAFGELELSMGRVTGLRIDETVGIPLGGGFICGFAGEAHARGTATLTNLPGTASVTITLI